MGTLIGSYLIWHYGEAFKDIWNHLKNLLSFIYHFFSIPVLLKTFFAPWRKLGEQYPKGIDIAGMLSTFFINSLMRCIGALFRFCLIVFGCVVLFAAFCLGLFTFVFWAVFPVILIVVFLSGCRLLFL